ncbi:hypothetical protein MXD59_20485 [Frankia sp. Ag45/Mut15]|uniref:Uncharacterized protein n=1 Tax=Frankia umida TaxID=573489 RepID=A0ABT0K2W1_9ACTN|nr:hypothetical protein [Frankia umida]MCK9878116.1 hypothetical protein [Frankia umida]
MTGAKDTRYDLLWFTESCLDNALRLETYIADAESDGDRELTAWISVTVRRSMAVAPSAVCSSRIPSCTRTTPPQSSPAGVRTARSEPLGTVTTGDHESAHRDRRVEQPPLAGLVEGPFQHDGELAASGEELARWSAGSGRCASRSRASAARPSSPAASTRSPSSSVPGSCRSSTVMVPVRPPIPADGDLAGPHGDNRRYP